VVEISEPEAIRCGRGHARRAVPVLVLLWQIAVVDSAPDAFRRFLLAADDFNALVEGSPRALERPEFLWGLRASLAELLAASFHLPDVESSPHDLPASVTADEWNSAFARLRSHLGVLDGDPEVSVVVVDDLADVWRDLRCGLDALKSGTPWQDVCWEWRFGLQTHWGKHAAHALAALHDA